MEPKKAQEEKTQLLLFSLPPVSKNFSCYSYTLESHPLHLKISLQQIFLGKVLKLLITEIRGEDIIPECLLVMIEIFYKF